MTEETIFRAALGKKDPTERVAYLDAACAGSPELRKQVEALLRSHDDSRNILDRPIAAAQAKLQGAMQTFTSPAPENGPKQSELAIFGPAREPGSLGSLDHYEVLEVVGRGGMGVVFKARDTKLQRIVAIKMLASHLAADGTSRKRFVREAQAAAAIRDTHVVGIHAVNEEGAAPYLVMEFIGGTTLQQQIKANGPPTLKETLRIAMQAAEGLAAAHRQGLIHRDVKPANILLENHVQRVKITDFGLARAGDNVGLTQSGMVAGTPKYMSPEQSRGELLDQRSDLFSLGSVLYFVCTGSEAFTGDNTMAVLRGVREDTPKQIRTLNSEIPDWLSAIVDKLLAKNPKDRFQSAAELAELLGEHLARLQHSGAAITIAATSVKKANRRRTIAITFVSLVILSASVAAIWLASFGLPGWVGSVAKVELPPKNEPTVVPPKDEAKPAPPPVIIPDPRVLTVSQKSTDGGEYRTINAALFKVEPGMTIRVLDEGVYDEQVRIDDPEKHRGVVLEAMDGKKPSLHMPAGRTFAVTIRDMSGFKMRGFRIEADPGTYDLIYVTGSAAGAVLERLELVGQPAKLGDYCSALAFSNTPLSESDVPITIQQCTIRGTTNGIYVEGMKPTLSRDVPQPCANIVFRENRIHGCALGVLFIGAPKRIQIVANVFTRCYGADINLREILPGAQDLVFANNTSYQAAAAFWVSDDGAKKNAFKAKNIRVHNNLVIEPKGNGDFRFFDLRRGPFGNEEKEGDINALLTAWRFSHNWREISPPKADDADAKFWIPGPKDTLKKPIEVLSRKQSDPDFLRPAMNSLLATTGVNDAALPGYLGALPPAGMEAWDWSKTWEALNRTKQ